MHVRFLRLSAAALVISLSNAACGADRSGDPGSLAAQGPSPEPTPEPVEARPPAAAPSDAAEPKAGGAESEPAMLASSDGKITTPRPPHDQWECSERVQRPPEREQAYLRCAYRGAGQFMIMMVKDTTITAEELRNGDALTRERRLFDKLYTSHTITREAPAQIQGFAATDLELDAVHVKTGPIHKRSRVLTHMDHMITISAEGMPGVFEANAEVAERWITEAHFSHLDDPAA